MHAKLVIIGGKASKSRVTVRLPTVIGRSRAADLTIAHPMISRKHCELYEVNGLVMIRDLGSLNGLFVGGTQVSEAALHPNAEFTVGPLTFRVEYEYAHGVAAPPEASTLSEASSPPQNGPGEQEIDIEGAEQRQPSPPSEGFFPTDQALVVEEEPPAADQPPPADAPPAIAPPDGQLPDFTAEGTGAVEPAEPYEAGGPLAPPPAPASPVPETRAFDQQELAELGGSGPPAADPAEPPSGPVPSAGGSPQSESPAAPQLPEAADEGTSESSENREPGVEQAEGEGLFDLSLPQAPDADQPDEAASPEEDFGDFLRDL